jgi:hypothetical protein
MYIPQNVALSGHRGSERVLEQALNQALKLEAAKPAARSPVRLQVVSARALLGPWVPGNENSGTGQPICWECGGVSHLRKDC